MKGDPSTASLSVDRDRSSSAVVLTGSTLIVDGVVGPLFIDIQMSVIFVPPID